MSEQPTQEAAAQQLQECFSMSQEQQLLALELRHNLRQLHSTERVVTDLQAVMAGDLSANDMLMDRRSLLDTCKEALQHTINKYKRNHALPESVCDDMLQELEDIL